MTVEAVNSAIANSAVSRGGVDQISASRAAQREAPSGDSASVETPYRSLNVEINANYDRAVLQVRDSQTGDVLNQFPSDTALRAQNAAQSSQPEQTPISNAASQGGGFEAAGSDASANVARAQVASQALSAAAQTSVESLSAGVSVSA